MNDHVYPSDWDKPKFFFGETVSLACLPDHYLWFGIVRGMHYGCVSKVWIYDVQISPCSLLIQAPDIPEIIISWLEPTMMGVENF